MEDKFQNVFHFLYGVLGGFAQAIVIFFHGFDVPEDLCGRGFSNVEQVVVFFTGDGFIDKTALQNIKGVYLIVDNTNGKKYVGSAYGRSGLWGRWSCYMNTGQGYNDELTDLINRKGIEFARQNFRMTLLEYFLPKTTEEVVIEREGYWKRALLSRGPFGYNKN